MHNTEANLRELGYEDVKRNELVQLWLQDMPRPGRASRAGRHVGTILFMHWCMKLWRQRNWGLRAAWGQRKYRHCVMWDLRAVPAWYCGICLVPNALNSNWRYFPVTYNTLFTCSFLIFFVLPWPSQSPTAITHKTYSFTGNHIINISMSRSTNCEDQTKCIARYEWVGIGMSPTSK